MAKLVSHQDYKEKSCFNPDWYLSNFYNMNNVPFQRVTKNTLMELVKLFSMPIFTGGKLLDVGCGPALEIVMTGSRAFKSVYMSDYSEHNCQTITQWLNRSVNTFDWTLHAAMIGSLETNFDDFCPSHKPNENKATLVEERARQAVKEVLPIDIHQANPLFDKKWLKSFDCMVSCYCLESASTSELIEGDIRNLSSLLKPGGHFIMIACAGQTSYQGNEGIAFETSGFTLKPDDVIEVFKKCGFEIIYKQMADFALLMQDCASTVEGEGWYTLLARLKA